MVDCGAAPGSWLQVASGRVGPRGRVLGIDLKAIDPNGLPSNVQVVEGDVFEADAPDLLGGKADSVLSDMAPFTTGTRLTDHVNQLELAQMAADVAIDCLAPGGHFIVKVFDGEDAHAFVQSLRPHFGKVRRIKPEATRDESVEFFVVCLGRSAAG